MQLAQGLEQRLHTVAQGNGRRGQRQYRGTRHQKDQPHTEVHGGDQPFPGDAHKAPADQHGSAAGKEQVQYEGQDQQEPQGLHSFQELRRLQPGHLGAQNQERQRDNVPHRVGHAEDHGDINDGQQDLRPGVQLVNQGFSRQILPQRNVLQHVFSSFRGSFSSASATSAGVYRSAGRG